MAETKMSPMMAHYMETKKQYPDCILFYRLGDFEDYFDFGVELHMFGSDIFLLRLYCNMI